jgi:hypothetical protein
LKNEKVQEEENKKQMPIQEVKKRPIDPFR